MRSTRFLIIASVMLLTRSLPAGVPAMSLTLEEALAAPGSANLNVLLSRESAVQALEQANVVRAAILPNIAASAQQRRTQAVTITNGKAGTSGAANRFDGLVTGNYSVLDPQRIS